MKQTIISRLGRLESRVVKAEGDSRGPSLTYAIIAIVAFHVGRWAPHEAIAGATARAIGVPYPALKHTLANEPDAFCGRIMRAVDGLVTERGGEPLGGDDDECLRGAMPYLAPLYDELSPALKDRMSLLPKFADYFV